jgi:hypothetical protein
MKTEVFLYTGSFRTGGPNNTVISSSSGNNRKNVQKNLF